MGANFGLHRAMVFFLHWAIVLFFLVSFYIRRWCLPIQVEWNDTAEFKLNDMVDLFESKNCFKGEILFLKWKKKFVSEIKIFFFLKFSNFDSKVVIFLWKYRRYYIENGKFQILFWHTFYLYVIKFCEYHSLHANHFQIFSSSIARSETNLCSFLFHNIWIRQIHNPILGRIICLKKVPIEFYHFVWH